MPAKNSKRHWFARLWFPLFSRREVHPNQATHVALALASLVAGLWVLINLDRNLYPTTHHPKGYNASQHGWPLIYLTRTFTDDVPNHVRRMRSFDWPWPPVQGERRSFVWPFVLVNAMLGVALVVSAFWCCRKFMRFATRK